MRAIGDIPISKAADRITPTEPRTSHLRHLVKLGLIAVCAVIALLGAAVFFVRATG
jgi:hypothetical protein